MDNFFYITVEATENGKIYTACIQLQHIVAITGARQEPDSSKSVEDLHTIHLVNGDKVTVRMTYVEILNTLKRCASFPLKG